MSQDKQAVKSNSLIIPDEVKPDDQPTLEWVTQANAHLVSESGQRFIGNLLQRWYDSALEGVPFIFAGVPRFEQVPDNFRKGQMKEACVVAVRLFDVTGHRSRYTVEAHLAGGYTKQAIKNLLPVWEVLHDNPRAVFTLERDPETEVNETSGKRSLNLARYTGNVGEQSEPSPFDEDAPSGGPENEPQTLAEFLKAAVALNPLYRDTGQLMAVLGVRSLKSVLYPQAYQMLEQAEKGGAHGR